ncbi:MAG: response regulator transcription factor [Deltaproteobacteria bacterium]|nr:response regulator transcription factor [Deltaproteobacteria bacterium]
MGEKKRIFIAEDHTILREGLKLLLSSCPDFEIIGEAADGLEAIQGIEKFSPDLVLIDLSMPRMDGIESIKEIKKRHPATKIMALTVHKTEEYVLAALRAGADGYILKDSTHSDLITAIKSVFLGKRYLSPGISKMVIEGYLEGKDPLKSKSSWETLTQRERGILKLIGEGYKNKEIAEFLCISPKTVEKHRSNLMSKLNLHSTSALTAFALEKGLIAK